jgi:hypothetical protein
MFGWFGRSREPERDHQLHDHHRPDGCRGLRVQHAMATGHLRPEGSQRVRRPPRRSNRGRRFRSRTAGPGKNYGWHAGALVGSGSVPVRRAAWRDRSPHVHGLGHLPRSRDRRLLPLLLRPPEQHPCGFWRRDGHHCEPESKWSLLGTDSLQRRSATTRCRRRTADAAAPATRTAATGLLDDYRRSAGAWW